MRYLVLIEGTVEDWEALDEAMFEARFFSVIQSEGHYYSLPKGVYGGESHLLTEQLVDHVEGLLVGLGVEARSLVVTMNTRSVARGLRLD